MRHSEHFRVPRPLPWSDVTVALTVRNPTRPTQAHPCGDCLAICCWYLILEDDTAESVEDLDAIETFLSYRGVMLWISPSAKFTLGIVTPCEHLDSETTACGLFGDPRRPNICREFDAHMCWYRRGLDWRPPTVTKMDLAGWRSYRPLIEVAIDGRVLGVPTTSRLPPPEPCAFSVPARLQVPIPGEVTKDDWELGDYLYFAAGFRGVQVVKTPETWALLYPTLRAEKATPGALESVGDAVLGRPPEQVFWPTASDLLWLSHEVPKFYQKSVEELTALVAGTRAAGG